MCASARRIRPSIAMSAIPPIVLQKSFCTGDQKFCGLQARLSRKDVRDLIEKIAALQLSTFATQSAPSGHRTAAVECPFSGVKRTQPIRAATAPFDPKRTWARNSCRSSKAGFRPYQSARLCRYDVAADIGPNPEVP